MEKKNRSPKILFGATFMFWFAQYAYTTYVNPELERIGMSAVFIGAVGGVYGLVQLVVRVPMGIAADRWQKKFFVCVGSLCAFLSPMCMFLSNHPFAFVLGRFLGGVSASAWVAFTVLYADYFSPEESVRSITSLNVANQSGRLVAFGLVGLCVARFGVKAAFLIAALGGAAAFALSLFAREAPRDTSRPELRVRELLAVAKDRNLMANSILTTLVQLVAFGTYYSFTSNYAVSIGAEQAQLSYMNVFMLVPSAVLILVVSKYLLRWIQPKWLILAGLLLTALYCGALPLVKTIPQLYMMQALAGMGTALTLSVMTGLCVRDVAPEKRSAAMGFFQAVYSIGMMMGPVLMGVLTDWLSLRAGFFAMAGIALLAALWSVFLFRTGTSREQAFLSAEREPENSNRLAVPGAGGSEP